MGGYFAYRGMAPFGNSSILTVDLGQQYVDFFAYFRSTLLHHFDTFFYSFSKDLGGDMIGIFAYYLMSPLNLLILFFPGKSLTSGILILLILKYGLSGLSFAWLLTKTKLQKGIRVLGFSTAYALMGWMIANQLNVIWLDVLILLPLVVWGLIKLVNENKPWTYIIWFTVLLIDNYYMAWMVALFTIMFMIWQLSSQHYGWHTSWHRFLKYIGSSILSALLASFLLIPTFYSLTQTKGTYTQQSVHFKFEYFPFKMLGKLMPGSFNFDQMPDGEPNIFIGTLLTIAFVLYLFDRRHSIKNRIISSLLTIFFLFSLCFEPLDLLWHAGQFPVWYPYRFSFLMSFWMLWLAAHTLTPDFHVTWRQLIPIVTVITGIYVYLGLNLSSFTYLTWGQLLISIGMCVVGLIWLTIPRYHAPILYDLVFFLLVGSEVVTNAYTSLNNISYVTQSDFGNYTTQLNKTVKTIQKKDTGFYRIGQTFMRTKDDPMQADYNGGSHFGSTLEPSIPSFMGSIGQPDGDGFVTYTNGTQVSDSLLNMRYFMASQPTQSIIGGRATSSILPAVSTKPDLSRQKAVSSDSLTKTTKNNNALAIAFGASDKITSLNSKTSDPVARQSKIYQTLANDKSTSSLFEVQNFDHVTFDNVQSASKITGTIFTKQNLIKNAEVKMTFTPKTNESYYLTFGSSLDADSGSYYLNGKKLSQYPTFRNTVVINVASNQKGEPVTLTFKLKRQTLWMQNVSLYKLNQKHFNRLNTTLKSESLHVTSHSNTRINGTVKINKNHQVLMTTIPYSAGWHAKVDGKPVATKKAIKTFLAIPISKGNHHVQLTYRPPYLITGISVTLVSILGIAGYQFNKHRKQNKRRF
ncbi:hypothetical protein IV59_GL001259 [Paucilactobacillus hokkaidonensis]|nr:hypothetical protein IV59_GL001259 [Paucilactobacillus hokkaidonensis]